MERNTKGKVRCYQQKMLDSPLHELQGSQNMLLNNGISCYADVNLTSKLILFDKM